MREQALESLVEERLATLRSKSVAELLRFPKVAEETIRLNGKEVQVFTIHETSDAGLHRVVLQAIRRRWWGITAKVVAHGFEIAVDQSFRPLTREELYSFT